jgi:hypothetical protein
MQYRAPAVPKAPHHGDRRLLKKIMFEASTSSVFYVLEQVLNKNKRTDEDGWRRIAWE